MIGDPSGRSSERNLLDVATLERNVAAIRAQLERFLDFSPGPAQAVMANNLDWLGKLSLIDYLRDVGKHFTVPYMLAKDSVQPRLERGLSFTEFSYMTLQAFDFATLYREHGVEMQMGGADQWGNITAGLELIRRTAGRGGDESPAHGIAYKLLLSPSGAKFGKSEGGESVWLDPARTTPYAFYQYWVKVDDRDVATYVRWFTIWGRERDRGAGRRGRDPPGGARGPAAPGARRHRARPRRGGGDRRGGGVGGAVPAGADLGSRAPRARPRRHARAIRRRGRHRRRRGRRARGDRPGAVARRGPPPGPGRRDHGQRANASRTPRRRCPRRSRGSGTRFGSGSGTGPW